MFDLKNIKIKKEKSLPESLDARKDGVLILPEGYRYCAECVLITPHDLIDKRWYNKYQCKLCGYTSGDGYNDCPNCGWEEPEDGLLFHDVTIHNPGCHCEAKEWERENLIGQIYSSHYSIAGYVADQFYRSWMKPAPDRGSYCLPKDKEWYDKNQHLKKRWREMKEMKCGCPTFRVYDNTHVINYSSRYYPSMDCMNAIEWDYDVRCPICGEIYHINDTNC